MDQNNIISFDQAKNLANSFTDKLRIINEEDSKRVTTFLQSMEQLTPGMGIEELDTLLSLQEEDFCMIAPVFLEEFRRAINNPNDKMMFAQAMNVSGAKLEDIKDIYNQLIEEIDGELVDALPFSKRDFIKQLLMAVYNVISETEGIAKRLLQVPIELDSENAKIPTYGTDGAAGLDLYSPEEYTIAPGETRIIPVDIKVALPRGYAFLIHPRSGTSVKTKLRIANSIGLIDSDYRGTIGVIVENIDPKIKDIEYEFDESGKPIIKSILHGSSYTIGKGERFAQMRLVEVPKAAFYTVSSVDSTERGEGGFGSTGKT